MNELGLPGHGAEPSFGADEAAYGVVVHAATKRRRNRALAGTSTTAALAVAAVAALSAPGGGNASLEPADTPAPTAVTTASARDETARPVALPSLVLPSGLPSGFPVPTPAPSGEPSASPSVSPRANPRPSHAPGTTQEWTESSRYVDDRPTETCAHHDPLAGWCLRILGPMTLASGEGATFESEMCRLTTARTDSRIDFDTDSEMSVALAGPEGAKSGETQMTVSRLDERAYEHSRPVTRGQCLRWSSTWNGLDVHGRPLRPGTYYIQFFLNGTTPGETPGSGSGTSRMWAWGSEEFTVT